MLSFLATPPPRTPRATHNPVTYTSSPTPPVTIFFPPHTSPHHVMRLTLPAGPSIAIPPAHWHHHQTESFAVVAGRLRVYAEHLPGGVAVLGPGERCTVPRGVVHRWENAAAAVMKTKGKQGGDGEKGQQEVDGSGEELTVDVELDPRQAARDEALFRNFHGYLDDCARVGKKPSVFQVMLFVGAADITVVFPGVPKFVSTALVWFLGVAVGKWLLGLRTSYEEYYSHEVVDSEPK